MKYLLDKNNMVVDKAEVPFKVHKDLRWVEHRDASLLLGRYRIVDGVAEEIPPPKLIKDDMELRIEALESILRANGLLLDE